MPSVAEQALEWLEKVKGHQVTVVGDDIVDEYVYVRPAGKSAKDNLVTFVSDGRKLWPGGARIIHRHLEALGCEATLCTTERPVVKTRYVDTAFSQKVFSVCNTDSAGLLVPWADNSMHLLIADFGHTQSVVTPGNDSFVSLMVQSNSLNWGFNPVTKYKQADYLVCDEMELRLATHNNWDAVEGLVKALAAHMRVRMMVVTLGHKGALMYDRLGGCDFHVFPAHARNVVDRMGAGDAFLAASAPLAALGAPAQVVGMVGSVAAGLHVEQEGNPPLCRERLIERLKELA